MSLESMLEDIGLTKKEAAVYLALAKGGAMGASDAAALAGMHRPNVYDALRGLERKGLASSFLLNGVKAYNARGAEGLNDFVKEKIDYVSEISKELSKYSSSGGNSCEVEVLSGRKAVRAVLFDILGTLKTCGGESCIVGVDERKFFEADSIAFMSFFNLFKESKFRERVIVEEGETYLPAPRETTLYRALPKKYSDSTAQFFVYGGKLAIVIFSEPIYVVTIKSKKVAISYKKKFELLWKMSKPIRR